MRVFRLSVFLAVVFGLTVMTRPVNAATEDDPSFIHGLGQVVSGVVWELPKTVIDATLTGPPIVGTMVGLLGGVARAVQTTFEGLREMSAGLNP